MYSPTVREDLILRLYQLKTKLKRPMTQLVNEAIMQYLETIRSKGDPMCAKKTDESVEPTVPEGQVLEATADIFYLTAEGMENHLQIKGTNTLFVLAESQTAIQTIVEAGGTSRAKANGNSKNTKSTTAQLPYYTDEKGVKRCNRMTVEGERCGEPVSQREGKYGPFWSCKNYKNHVKGNGNGHSD